MITMIKYIS